MTSSDVPMTAGAGASVPLTLLTGFLGAGKTTVLNRILAGDHGLRVAVLVNDFGDLDIAEELIEDRSGDTVRLTNGCICCNLKEGLVAAVSEVLHRDPRPEHVVLEASGVADPTGIATTLLAPVFRGRIRLDGVVCIVDAREFHDEHAEEALILRQLMVSDLVLLNKVDVVPESVRQLAETRIRGWLSRARIIPTVHGDAPLEVLLSSSADTLAVAEHAHGACSGEACAHPAHTPHSKFDTWYFAADEALCPETLRELIRELPREIYRIKGLVQLESPAGTRALVQGVGRHLGLELLDGLPMTAPRSRLVVIGASGSLDDTALSLAFARCNVHSAADETSTPGSARAS